MNQEHSSLFSTLFPIIKAALAVVAVTFVLLLLLALLLYRLHLSDSVVNVCILLVYFLSNFAGGFFIGKAKQAKKFLWGFLTGFTYFLLLAIVSFLVLKGFCSDLSGAFICLLICVGGGMIGGMLA
jgi:putative membrane protein (TIGR04086 family)